MRNLFYLYISFNFYTHSLLKPNYPKTNQMIFYKNSTRTTSRALLRTLAFTLIFSGCAWNNTHKHFSEGTITYTIVYDDALPFKYDSSIRPSEMEVKFKSNNTINRIEGLSGGFSFAIVQNHEENKVHTLINFMGKKLCYTESVVQGSYPLAFYAMPYLTITKTDERVEFMGFNCLKAIAGYEDSIRHEFEILYTDELAINKPNRNSPFAEIEGIMLKFNMIFMGQNIQLVANSISSQKVNDDEFDLESGYEKVDKDVVEDFFQLIQ